MICIKRFKIVQICLSYLNCSVPNNHQMIFTMIIVSIREIIQHKMKRQLLFAITLFLIQFTQAQNTSNSYLVRETTGVSGASELISSNNQQYVVQQSIGQGSAIGTFNNVDYILRQGFIQPNVLAKIIGKDILLNLEAIIYPNPFVESISISFNEKVSNKIEVAVFDVLGRVVFSKNYNAEQNLQVQLNNLSVANYILKVTANNKKFIKNIIKK